MDIRDNKLSEIVHEVKSLRQEANAIILEADRVRKRLASLQDRLDDEIYHSGE